VTLQAELDRKKRLLIVVSAPSGTGKTTLCNEVIKQLPNLSFSVSHTTREPREGEKQGEDYYFVNEETFKAHVKEGKIAEWTEIYGNLYGTAKKTIEKEFDRGIDIIFDIDERGGCQLSESFSDVVTVLILPPSMEILKKRLIDRGTNKEADIVRRLKQAKEEIKGMSWYRYVIVNDEVEKAVLELKAIITAERCSHDHSLVERLLKNGS
jgi:guanylate kinase